MDDIDIEIKELIDNFCCISNPKHLERLHEGQTMFEKCAKCQTRKTGEGYGSVPPDGEWMENDVECHGCDVIEWFGKHG